MKRNPQRVLKRYVDGRTWVALREPGCKTVWHTEDQRWWVIRSIGSMPWELYEGNPYAPHSNPPMLNSSTRMLDLMKNAIPT